MATQPPPRQDQFDAQGRFIGRSGGVAGRDYGVGDQNNDFLGNNMGNYNQLVGLMQNGFVNPSNGQQMTGLQALSAQAMGQVNTGVSTMGNATNYSAPPPAATQAQALQANPNGAQWGGADVAQNARTYGSDLAGRAASQFATGRAGDTGAFGK